MVLNAAVKKNFTAVFSKTNFLYQDYDSVPVILKYDKSVRDLINKHNKNNMPWI